ncbi:MAG: transposase [Lentisphaeria bacterium]
MSYHKIPGFAPIFCYAGREGFMVANELRPGSQHCGNGAVEFLKRCIAIMIRAGYKAKELLVRVDSGYDSSDFIKTLSDLKVKYLVKRNLRKKSSRQLLDSWWTNLSYSVSQCATLYHDHGTSEHFHSELKSDMGIEPLPRGNLKTNALVLGLATVAFNCLRFIGQAALQSVKSPADAKSCPLRYRQRTVLLDFIKVGSKIVSHANQIIQKFGRNYYKFFTMIGICSLS